MGHYRRLYDSPWLASWDIDKDTVVTIKQVVAGEVGGHQGQAMKKRPIVFFEGATKGMVCNATNGKSIASMYGNDTDDWIGKRITLYTTDVEVAGAKVGAIRVRPGVPRDAK